MTDTALASDFPKIVQIVTSAFVEIAQTAMQFDYLVVERVRGADVSGFYSLFVLVFHFFVSFFLNYGLCFSKSKSLDKLFL